jgi:hypothetical protein
VDKNKTTGRSAVRTLRRQRLVAIVGSVALIASLSGNAAARQLNNDSDWSSAPLVTPRVASHFTAVDWVARKLATTAGRNALIY